VEIMPKLVIHNSISLDGSLTGFEPNMGLHYHIAAKYKPDAHMIGSNTAKTGLALFGDGDKSEEESDFSKPSKDNSLPYWVIPDTRGILLGLLHNFRRFEFCRDVVVLISKKTPERYVKYLKERHYDYHVVGAKHVDVRTSLELLSMRYRMKTILADTGRILSNLLLDQGLADEISLLVHPVIVGESSYNIFGNTHGSAGWKLVRCEKLEKDYVWMVFRHGG
jgi:2,5-diamino-6-(ribosylamino)-4(3H)-pyrimidinone 5'-phosphate reductase